MGRDSDYRTDVLSRTTNRNEGCSRSGRPVRAPATRSSSSVTANRPISALSGEIVVREGAAKWPSSMSSNPAIAT